MSNGNNNNINLPLVIIGLVLIVALVGGWFLYSRSKATNGVKTNSSPKPAATKPTAPTPDMANAPLGAQPPNFLGSANAAVTIEEFADFQCGSCANTYPILQEIKSIYGSRIKFIYRSFPLIQIHQKAYDAAVAAEAAGIQGKFWDMQNLLFTNQQTWVSSPDHRKIFNEYAQKIGIDPDKFETDSLGMAAKSRVDADMQRGRALNISSTPTVYINGVSIPYDQVNVPGLKTIIDGELQKAQSNPQKPDNSGGVTLEQTDKTNSNTKK